MKQRVSDERLAMTLVGLPIDMEILSDLDRLALDLRDARAERDALATQIIYEQGRSLAEHDAEVVERCATVSDEHEAQRCHALPWSFSQRTCCGRSIAAAIRTLKPVSEGGKP